MNKGITYRQLKNYKYELLETYSHDVGILPPEDIITRYVSLLRTGILVVSERYAWDGPSGPTWDTKDTLRASLVHDALYQLMSMGLIDHRQYRTRADQLLRDIMLEDGRIILSRHDKGFSEWVIGAINPIRSRVWYRTVDVAAESHALPDGKGGEDPVLTAP
jgi:hypothetical protein